MSISLGLRQICRRDFIGFYKLRHVCRKKLFNLVGLRRFSRVSFKESEAPANLSGETFRNSGNSPGRNCLPYWVSGVFTGEHFSTLKSQQVCRKKLFRFLGFRQICRNIFCIFETPANLPEDTFHIFGSPAILPEEFLRF